jgi:steroid 5-alpha reductase family enzyme
MLWYSYYLFSVAALGGESVQALFNASIVVLSCCSAFSIVYLLHRRNHAKKYPADEKYQKQVSRKIPLPPKKKRTD